MSELKEFKVIEIEIENPTVNDQRCAMQVVRREGKKAVFRFSEDVKRTMDAQQRFNDLHHAYEL